MKQKKEFVTPDLYSAAFFSLYLNQFPSFKVEAGRTLFIFEANADLYKAIGAYNAGVPMNAFGFAQQIKRLRGEMLARRGMRMDGGERKNAKEGGGGKE